MQTKKKKGVYTDVGLQQVRTEPKKTLYVGIPSAAPPTGGVTYQEIHLPGRPAAPSKGEGPAYTSIRTTAPSSGGGAAYTSIRSTAPSTAPSSQVKDGREDEIYSVYLPVTPPKKSQSKAAPLLPEDAIKEELATLTRLGIFYDVASAREKEILHGKPIGTFLLRRSSDSLKSNNWKTFVVSYISTHPETRKGVIVSHRIKWKKNSTGAFEFFFQIDEGAPPDTLERYAGLIPLLRSSPELLRTPNGEVNVWNRVEVQPEEEEVIYLKKERKKK